MTPTYSDTIQKLDSEYKEKSKKLDRRRNYGVPQHCIWPGCTDDISRGWFCHKHAQRLLRIGNNHGLGSKEVVGIACQMLYEIVRLEKKGVTNPSISMLLKGLDKGD